MARRVPSVADVAGIILIGGRSSRMGRDKTAIEIAGRPMWRWVADALETCTSSLYFAGEADGLDSASPFPILPDDPPGLGPLGGLATALERSGRKHNLIVAADYPLVRPKLLNLLLEKSTGHMATCGRTSEFLEPLVGYYNAACAPVIRTMLAEGELRTHQLFTRAPSHILTDEEYESADPDRLSQINVNTPADLARVVKLVADGVR